MTPTALSSSAAPPAIRAENLCRHYTMGGSVVKALDGVSLEVRSGERVALLGASGSGKSTLLHLMAGLDRPTSGTLETQGHNLASMSPEDLAGHRRKAVGMIFQAFHLLPRMTLEENVELPLRLAEMPREERPARVREALDRVGLGARAGHRPGELSGGEQQRAAIARALVNRPAILLADEPTGNLDSRNGDEIMRLIGNLNDTLGMTIVLVTHEQKLASHFAGRMFVLSDGRMAAEGRPGDPALEALR
ncbi:MAG TPA: ABC transporter ATP-binding protein [Candidatus Acidoferrales bacterium]|nr:ABC transporter ATP-binding protein [Candidatus Acidoferrales bacterium]